ncbi:MAG: hypothetical protein H6Q73_86 [Firmicutes bacterium]|nr:hypothetical protein [Bacillota bacterium]
MYITVKKEDSVISILLFIFNVFLLDRGITQIPLKKIFQVLVPFQKNESAIRMGLSREIRNGMLINKKHNNETYYHLTDKAINSFKHWIKTMDYNQQMMKYQLSDWNGTWNILMLHNSNAEKDYWDELIQTLSRLKFGNLDKNIWISPYHIPSQIEFLQKKYQLDKNLFLFESCLNTANTPTDLAKKIWPIKKLGTRYNQYLDSLSTVVYYSDTKVRLNGDELPLLYSYGLKLFEIVQDDPRLPIQVLPSDWLGIEAVKKFTELRSKLLPKAYEYINNILGD